MKATNLASPHAALDIGRVGNISLLMSAQCARWSARE
jgi:hypothetical protein